MWQIHMCRRQTPAPSLYQNRTSIIHCNRNYSTFILVRCYSTYATFTVPFVTYVTVALPLHENDLALPAL